MTDFDPVTLDGPDLDRAAGLAARVEPVVCRDWRQDRYLDLPLSTDPAASAELCRAAMATGLGWAYALPRGHSYAEGFGALIQGGPPGDPDSPAGVPFGSTPFKAIARAIVVAGLAAGTIVVKDGRIEAA